MERGWLEAGKGGPYVPRRHPAECGGPLSGRGFGPGRPDLPERLRETAGPGIAVDSGVPDRAVFAALLLSLAGLLLITHTGLA
jgi:hypothetical protein